MKLKDYIECVGDRRRKKRNLIVSILIAALILYIPVCSLSDSIHEGVNRILSSMSGRIIIVQEDGSGYYEKLTEQFHEDKRVLGVYPYINQIYILTENFIDGTGFLFGSIQSYDDCMKEYICVGKAENLKEDEILIPKYLYGYVEGKRYEDGDKYIGQTIKLIFKNTYLNTEKEETFTIAGTYDNIYGITGDMSLLVNSRKAVELYEFDNDGIELVKQQMMEASGNYDESSYYGFENVYYYGIFLSDRSFAGEILSELELGHLLIEEASDSVENIFDAVRVAGAMVSGMLLIILAIVIVLGVLHDMQERKWEFAMKLVFGYRKEQLTAVTFLEYIQMAVKAYVITMAVSIIFNIAGNFIIENFLPEELLCIHLTVSGYTAGTGLLITILMAAVSVPVCMIRLKDIDIGKVLKVES